MEQGAHSSQPSTSQSEEQNIPNPGKKNNPISVKKKKNFLIVISCALFSLLLCVGGIAAVLVTLAVIEEDMKEKVEATHTSYIEYAKAIDEVANTLNKIPNKDPEDAERSFSKYAQDAKEEIDQAETRLSTLEENRNKLNREQTTEYRKHIDTYMTESDKLLTIQRDAINFHLGLVQPVKEYKELIDEASKVSIYIVSDPDRYADEIERFINGLSEMITDIEELQLDTEKIKSLRDTYLAIFKEEVTYLQKLKTSAEKRDEQMYNKAREEYIKNLKTKRDNYRAEIERIEQDTENIVDELNNTNELILEEFAILEI
ncbi:MAG: hypothetical protein ACOCXT_01025 [Candidatus Dojkabacteria bacterium]